MVFNFDPTDGPHIASNLGDHELDFLQRTIEDGLASGRAGFTSDERRSEAAAQSALDLSLWFLAFCDTSAGTPHKFVYLVTFTRERWLALPLPS